MIYSHLKVQSPVGTLHLVANSKKLVAVVFDSNWKEFFKNEKIEIDEKPNLILKNTAQQLAEYFSGERKVFEIPIELNGSEFQTKAWTSLLTIPYGKTISYGEQAHRIKNPKAVRAIGAANGRNKICIIIPCHRVIGKNGSLTGFGGGLKIKEQLLKFEKSF